MRTATLAKDPKLARIASALRETFGARLVSALLFGSRARGDHRPDSDYDVAVLLHDFDHEHDRETLSKLREALGEEVRTLQFWPLASDGLAERTTLTFNIRNEAVALRGFSRPAVAASPIAPDEEAMKPETKILLDSASQSLATVSRLRSAGFPKPAAREAYQAALRAARALIFEERDKAPKTHRETAMFSDAAVKTGRMTEELASALSGGLNLRMDIDYEPIPKTTDQQAAEYVERSERFVAAVGTLIKHASK